MQTKDQQIEALLKQNQQLIDQLKQQQSTTHTSIRYESRPKQESSFMDTVVSGAAFGVGFSAVSEVFESIFD